MRDVSSQTDKYYVDVTGVKHDVAPASRPPKPVDEDLYKIPPELIYSSRRVKRLIISPSPTHNFLKNHDIEWNLMMYSTSFSNIILAKMFI